MCDEHVLSQEFEIKGGDFGNAGKTSTSIKEILREIGIDSSIVVRACIASYEAEMNVVMYARRATLRLSVSPRKLYIRSHNVCGQCYANYRNHYNNDYCNPNALHMFTSIQFVPKSPETQTADGLTFGSLAVCIMLCTD